MSNIAERLPASWHDALPGVTTASLLVVLLVATASGALAGAIVDHALPPVALAILSGVIATVSAGVVRNTLLVRAWGAAGVHDAGTPASVIVYAAVASLAGSLAAAEIVTSAGLPSPALVGTMAGVLSAALLGLLMVTDRSDTTGA
jgi:hypothetical protein